MDKGQGHRVFSYVAVRGGGHCYFTDTFICDDLLGIMDNGDNLTLYHKIQTFQDLTLSKTSPCFYVSAVQVF